MARATTATPTPASVAGELLTLTRRPQTYRIDPSAPQGATGEGSYVTRGVHNKTGALALVHVDGSTQTALPLACVGTAILHGVISDSEIEAIRELRQ